MGIVMIIRQDDVKVNVIICICKRAGNVVVLCSTGEDDDDNVDEEDVFDSIRSIQESYSV